ncbi:MAG: phosphatase PAP2 family protein [Janthinobacterium lividum]
MRVVSPVHSALALGQRYPFLAFTALTVPAGAVLTWWLDKPLALFLHRYVGVGAPFFASFTAAVDAAYAAANVGGRPTLFGGLGLAYVVGRWVLRWRGASVLLVTLLTHLCSAISANRLRVMVHRPRPAVLFDASATDSFSFPSGHTAIYWSLFLPLAVAFPRWRLPLLALPALVALGRLVLEQHYLSDVWAAIWLVAAWTMLFGLLRRWM